ncbi:acetyltransferase [Alphaproteobacteria bacterium]|nr:acetyltransferase [Alphaproteobacteria bacterium]
MNSNMKLRKLIIFGTGSAAEVAAECVEEWNTHDLIGFTVDQEYKTQDSFRGKPVIALDKVLRTYDPRNVSVFVASGYANLSSLRQTVLTQLSDNGFETPTLINPNIRLPRSVSIGKNCLVLDNVYFHPFVKIGDNNFLWSGVVLSHHVVIKNNSWFTSGVVVAGNTVVGNNCFFGAGATIGNNISVGESCFIGAGVLVTKNLPDNSVVIRQETERHRLSSNQFLKLINNQF